MDPILLIEFAVVGARIIRAMGRENIDKEDLVQIAEKLLPDDASRPEVGALSDAIERELFTVTQ